MTRAELIELSWNRPLLVGHRGAPSLAPENTIPSFEAAIAAGTHAIECDVHMSADGEVMVIHDDTADRTTEIGGKIAEISSSELRRHGVPTLDEFLEVVWPRAVPIVELKSGSGLVAATRSRLQQRGLLAEAILFSFDQDLLRAAKSEETFLVHLGGVALEFDGAGLPYTKVSPQIAHQARQSRKPLFVWTAPPGPEVGRLISAGVNFLITDHPTDASFSRLI